MRILVVDDDPVIHATVRCSLIPGDGDEAAPGRTTADRPEWWPEGRAAPPYRLTHCRQGLEAVAAVEAALAAGDPFAVALIDVRMPPGIDGRETAQRIRALDPAVNLVIITGYSDFSPLEISRSAGPVDKIFYLAKPFDVAEVQQIVAALAGRWAVDRELAAVREQLAAQILRLEEQSAELAANESRAMHLATHDSLTDAPNRLAFQRALAARARGGGSFGVAMIDLDRFKTVNDTLGHLAGDEMIRSVSTILQQAAPAGAMVARLGGDEFGLLFDAPGEEAAVMICDRALSACAVPVRVIGTQVQAGASAGVVVAQGGEGCDALDALRRADLALNAAKQAGKGVTRLFDEGMDESIRFRRRIESGLSEAIERGELSVAYQAIVARDSFDVVGFEALVRWDTPEYGPIGPTTFIPIAEESNLIHELGDWVLVEALAQVAAWPGQYVSINFSPRQFRRSGFVGHLVRAVQRAGVEPQRVQIEITETAIFDDAERAAETLYRLRQMGFRIALDDFGTGYSSLYNIRKFALDCLKIDRSFIDGMGRERESAAIVHSIVHLGRSLGLGIVAEGVETEAQVQALRLAGASHLQGFLVARPVAADQARRMAMVGADVQAHEDADAPVEALRTGTWG